MTARVKGLGFRNDGSYTSGKPPPDITYREKVDDILLNRNLTGALVIGNQVSAKNVQELSDFIQYARGNKIHVIGFFPPFPHSIFEAIKKQSANYQHLFDLEQKIKPFFEDAGFSLFDFSDLATLGATDEETLNPTHVSEKVYLRILIAMADKDPLLGRSVDVAFLRKLLTEAKDSTSVIDEP
jgi:hypothetical protein